MTSVAQRISRRRTRAEIARANAIANRESYHKRRTAAAEAAAPAKNSALYRLQGALTRQQYEAGCRLRDDWLDHLDAKAGGIPSDAHGGGGGIPHERMLRQGAALHRYNDAAEAVSREHRSCVIAVCAGDRLPADLARRLTTTTEAAIMLGLRRGLDMLCRHYGKAAR
jgi:hypothetical protein